MANILQLMPSLEGDEMAFIQELIKDMTDEEAQQFAMAYMARRKDPTNILIFTIIGLLGIADIQRFVLGQIGMGILYLLTIGLCYIGTIVDLVNYKKLAYEYNTKEAQYVVSMMKSLSSK